MTITQAENTAQIDRPSMHFTPPSHWMNDPNGMVYYQGEYHLFYQHYPDGLVWGPMHWGHAVSKNLIDWQHLPIALYPDDKGMIFSGSAVVDSNNTSGLGSQSEPPIVALFTYHDEAAKQSGSKTFQSQGLAYSLDRGRSWTKYAGNPVLPNPGLIDFRDPKISWHAPSQRWVMVVTQGDELGFYSSANLLQWRHESNFGKGFGAHGGVWECPDLIKIGDHYVLIVSLVPGGPNGGSATQYFVGDFDGTTFTPAKQHRDNPSQALWLDWGPDNYAGVTFAQTEHQRTLPVFLGWASNWDYATKVPATTWRSMLTLPRELFMFTVSEQWRLGTRPVVEVDTAMAEVAFSADQQKLALPIEGAVKLAFKIHPAKDQKPYLVMSNDSNQRVELSLDMDSGEVVLDRRHSGITEFSDGFAKEARVAHDFDSSQSEIDIYYDGNLIEVFVDGGRSAMTALVFPSMRFNRLHYQGIEIKHVLTSAL